MFDALSKVLKGGRGASVNSFEMKRLGTSEHGVRPYRPRQIGPHGDLDDGESEDAPAQKAPPEPPPPPPPKIDVEAIRNEAFQKGVLQGESAGAAAAKLDYERKLAELRKTLESLLETRPHNHIEACCSFARDPVGVPGFNVCERPKNYAHVN